MKAEARIISVNADSLTAEHCGRTFTLPFSRYPWFKFCTVNELFNVQASAAGLHWPEADIDIETDLIGGPAENASAMSMDWWLAERRKKALSAMGAAGGSVSSPRKAAAARRNGAKGGRPPRKNTQKVKFSATAR
jgi:hypothetical protein